MKEMEKLGGYPLLLTDQLNSLLLRPPPCLKQKQQINPISFINVLLDQVNALTDCYYVLLFSSV